MIDQIISAIQSSEFKSDLKEYLYYGANIKLEKFIAFSLSKTLSKAGHETALEKRKVDIALPGCKIELKFHYDFDVLLKLPAELNSLQCGLLDYYNQLSEREGSKTWMIAYGVLRDIFIKRCDVFIWIVSERDFSSYKEVMNLENVCFVPDMKKLYKLGNGRNIDEVIRNFSRRLLLSRKHKLLAELVSFDEPVVSKVYFFIFDFSSDIN